LESILLSFVSSSVFAVHYLILKIEANFAFLAFLNIIISFAILPGMLALLSKAEDLHMSALKLAMTTFGEMNVQTAKHFGNLGRLYQSMKKFLV
jgi:hypothetical protein